VQNSFPDNEIQAKPAALDTVIRGVQQPITRRDQEVLSSKFFLDLLAATKFVDISVRVCRR